MKTLTGAALYFLQFSALLKGVVFVVNRLSTSSTMPAFILKEAGLALYFVIKPGSFLQFCVH